MGEKEKEKDIYSEIQRDRKTEREKQEREREQVDSGMLFTDAICGGRILGNLFFN